MTRVRDAVGEAVRNLRHGGPSVVLELLSRTYLRAASSMPARSVYEEEWDLLIVLDACRADLFADVVADDDRFAAGETRTSVGSTSTEWMAGTFGPATTDDLRETAYVTGNPYSATHVDADAFGLLDEVWRYAWDDRVGTIPARPLTDRAITIGRTGEFDRLVVHYMQPHFPCVPAAEAGDGIELDAWGDDPVSVWEDLRFGRRSEADVWEAYRANLRYVLDDVALLLENVDADRAVVTADHGNAVGEWWLYGHLAGVALPCLREVPWCVTSAADARTHDPAEYDVRGSEEEDVAARLEALGYA